MVSAVVRTPKLSDGEILSLASELLKIEPEGVASINYPVGQTATVKADTKLDKSQLSDSRHLILDMEFRFAGTVQETVNFHRGTVEPDHWRQHPNKSGFLRSTPSAYFDELGFLEPERGYGGQQPERDKLSKDVILAVAALVNSKAAEASAVGTAEPSTLNDIVVGQIHELRSLHLEMTSGLAEARLAADKELAERRRHLDEELSKRTSNLAEREAELEERRQELNDREPQHERRRLREHLTDRLQRTIAEPPQVTGARERQSNYLYLAIGAVFIAISIGLAALSDAGLDPGSAAFWARSLKSLVSGIAGAAFAWAGLSGLKASAVAARNYEQAIQRYAFDMDRASWVVETILQMNSNEETNVPDEWLEAVCRDLFVPSDKRSDENKSLEAFAALFDATAKARIGTQGLEFEIDRKGARKLAQD